MREIRVKENIRLLLLKIGPRMPATLLANVRAVLSYLELGYWLNHDTSDVRPQVVGDKESLFSIALSMVKGDKPLYLEFGVFEGRSMRWWSQHLRNPAARLIGFDSFEGLPGDWRPGFGVGAFATEGPPDIDDHRVSFEVGWFEESLSSFVTPEHDQLIINVDSDLYSSAVTVLTWAEPHLKPGTLIYFDEFPDRDHEMRAFMELLERGTHQFRPVAIARGGIHWLFEVIS